MTLAIFWACQVLHITLGPCGLLAMALDLSRCHLDIFIH